MEKHHHATINANNSESPFLLKIHGRPMYLLLRKYEKKKPFYEVKLPFVFLMAENHRGTCAEKDFFFFTHDKPIIIPRFLCGPYLVS